jgi:sRNA-binding protein
MPHFSHKQFAKFAMERRHGAFAFDREQRSSASATSSSAFLNSACVAAGAAALRSRDNSPIVYGIDEVAVGQALHQRAGAEAIRAVIGEIRFAEHEQPGHVAHQL